MSIRKTDPGYENWLRERPVRVYLNGAQVNAVTADEEAGEVLVHVRDVCGKLVVQNRELLTETLRGVVRIERIGAPPCPKEAA